MVLSIVIPVYNEQDTILGLLEKIHQVKIDKQIIVVNDGSTDNTAAIIAYAACIYPIEVITLEQNSGKGNAIRRALEYVKGDLTIIQDADDEYNPSDYVRLIAPIKSDSARVVYGSRFLNKNNRIPPKIYIANKMLALLTNILFHTRLTDEATCYKVFATDVFNQLDLKCQGFDFCPEVTAKILRLGYKIHEVPISYHARTSKQGKKLKYWRDGMQAVWTLIKYRLTR
jgi:glycosyltransferase involved in cell wall biosynthesis